MASVSFENIKRTSITLKMEFQLFLVLLIIGGVWSMNKRDTEECDVEEIEQCVDSFEESVEIGNSEHVLCREVYPIMSCLHDFAEKKFPNSDMMDNFLCKMRNLEDRVQTLSLTEQIFNEEESSGEEDVLSGDEEALKCLESVQIFAQECAELAKSNISNMIKENNAQVDFRDLNSVKCFLINFIMECTMDRLGERCPEDIVGNIREGVVEKMAHIMKDECKTVENAGVDME